MTMLACICGCHRPAQDWHHVVTQAELRKHGGDPGDRANMVRLSDAVAVVERAERRVSDLEAALGEIAQGECHDEDDGWCDHCRAVAALAGSPKGGDE